MQDNIVYAPVITVESSGTYRYRRAVEDAELNAKRAKQIYAIAAGIVAVGLGFWVLFFKTQNQPYYWIAVGLVVVGAVIGISALASRRFEKRRDREAIIKAAPRQVEEPKAKVVQLFGRK